MKVGQDFNPYRMFVGVFIPNALLRYKDISHGAKIVYGRLAQYAGEDGEAYPAYSKLAEEVATSKRTCMRYIEELVNYRLIKVIHRKDEVEQHTSNVYRFLWHEIYDEGVVTDLTPGSDRAVTRVVSGMSPKENHLKRISEENNPPADPLLSKAQKMFEDLWKLYPRRMGKGQVTDKTKLKLLDIGKEELVRCINRFVEDMTGQSRTIDKYPYGSTFFNSGYIDYLDENYEDVKPKKPTKITR